MSLLLKLCVSIRVWLFCHLHILQTKISEQLPFSIAREAKQSEDADDYDDCSSHIVEGRFLSTQEGQYHRQGKRKITPAPVDKDDNYD